MTVNLPPLESPGSDMPSQGQLRRVCVHAKPFPPATSERGETRMVPHDQNGGQHGERVTVHLFGLRFIIIDVVIIIIIL